MNLEKSSIIYRLSSQNNHSIHHDDYHGDYHKNPQKLHYHRCEEPAAIQPQKVVNNPLRRSLLTRRKVLCVVVSARPIPNRSHILCSGRRLFRTHSRFFITRHFPLRVSLVMQKHGDSFFPSPKHRVHAVYQNVGIPVLRRILSEYPGLSHKNKSLRQRKTERKPQDTVLSWLKIWRRIHCRTMSIN